jgi:pyridoxamine 5'-phosphate oxidase
MCAHREAHTTGWDPRRCPSAVSTRPVAIVPRQSASVRALTRQNRDLHRREGRLSVSMAVVPDLSRMRRDYGGRGLREEDLAGGWVEQFDRWFADAVAAELPEPNAMVMATADADGAPDARIVLMKGYDAFGFVFVTSYASAKGAQLAVNPRAALVFPWHALQRQVRVAGRVERVGDAASDDLWNPRPLGAQLAAVASVQSSVVESREELEDRVRLLAEETGDGPLPRPPVWGGYRVVPDRVEFWQGGADRLHDRLRFVRDDDEGGGWIVQRLAP